MSLRSFIRRGMLTGAAALAAGAAIPTAVRPRSAIADPIPTPDDLAGPWQSPDAAIMLDPYHFNQYTTADLKLDPLIVGIVHKRSEGAAFEDKKYEPRKAEAIAAGYLWGSYHLVRPGDPEAQAQRYFDLTHPTEREVIAFDLEQDGGAMSMAESATFIRHLFKLTNRYPLMGDYILDKPTLTPRYKGIGSLSHEPVRYRQGVCL